MNDYGHELLSGTMLEPPAPWAANILRYAELVGRSGINPHHVIAPASRLIHGDNV